MVVSVRFERIFQSLEIGRVKSIGLRSSMTNREPSSAVPVCTPLKAVLDNYPMETRPLWYPRMFLSIVLLSNDVYIL